MCDPAYTKHHKRAWAATSTGNYGTEVAALAPEDSLKSKSLGFSVKGQESCGGPELWIGCLL